MEVQEFLLPAMDFFEKARPTEPMMFNGMAYIKDQIKNTDLPLTDFLHNASEAAKCYLGMITDTAKKAIENGI